MRTRTKLLLAASGAAMAAGLVARRRHWDGFLGRVVLITGGSRGLGLELSREFARRGARLAICARDAAEIENAREELEALGAEVFTWACDVSDREQAQALIEAVERRYGRIDVLVNNAGVIQVGPLDDQTLEDYEQAMGVHYWGPLYLTLAALPLMRELRGGRVVNIASIGGKVSVPHLLPYDASKFALVGLSEGMRAELAADRIWVTTVCPGLMRTGSPPNALFKGHNKLEYAWFSVSDSLPLLSMSAERAARRIVEACRRGEAEVVLSVPAKAAAIFHGVFPGITANIMALANRLLPPPGGIGARSARGRDSESAVTRSFLTKLGRDAGRRNNET